MINRIAIVLLISGSLACKERSSSGALSVDSKGIHEISEELRESVDIELRKFSAARTLLSQRVLAEDSTVTKNEWNQLLASKLSPEGLASLSAWHQAVARAAKLENIRRSTIDLDRIRRSAEATAKFCETVPKGGMLHIHPSGTMSKETVGELLETYNPVIDGPKLVKTIIDSKMLLYGDEITLLESMGQKQFRDLDLEMQERFLRLFALPKTPYTHEFERFDAFFAVKDLLLK